MVPRMEKIETPNSVSECLSRISLCTANFGNAAAFEAVLDDWIRFLGGRPAEIIVVDGGSKPETHEVYWKLFNRRKIDKLQVIRKDHPDNDREKCFYQEHTAAAVSSSPYILLFKSDTLPYRRGHDNWLVDAIGYLERDDTFAVGGSFNVPSKHHEAWPGWYFSDKCSENFALMKRVNFIKAMEEFAGEYISSGFRGENPVGPVGGRYLIEVAFERFIAKHQKYTLTRVEDSTWTVFHTNVQEKQLVEVREKYLARIDVEKYMNARIYNRVWGDPITGFPRCGGCISNGS
jgi:hypothetical protein